MKNSKLSTKLQDSITRSSTFNFALLTFNSRQGRAGFTMIEILIGMSIFVALLGTVVALQSSLGTSENFSLRTIFTIENANASLRTLTDELRSSRPSEAGSFPLEKADAQEIIFYANVDSDPQIEHVRYYLDGTELKKGTVQPTGFPVSYPSENEQVKTVAEDIRNGASPVFSYYNQDWPVETTTNPLSTPAPLNAVTLVKVSVRVNADPTHPESEFSLEPFVQIRSLKTNL
ncbi:MAG: hypothetical protein A2900_05515 [Candidatus Chisholmbacteria bacterium RIFCSPLOWO2_01_FULL_50_28]|uniref:Type II secretion system protein J n=1 Tax=Candidatus Chisholmbacteria bacterium RIFCSPHIGHO2_01_FULL_52_32 TaxID=1797591 RepID=A0A1G1VRT5_9BACT|nr:MAG: hypothetical protein A2786_01230 [Candidatus Chisholmbacteria bacterium RIFCSPHIGHO2_01_FULL_52_32]OGY20502.1 MAG: hypothetical protein A2900_05515 [Candidatus Chisholmbacteria bacterium RIFCSPLOWO2_01_FULL_50_28]